MPLPENIIILFYWTAPQGSLFKHKKCTKNLLYFKQN